MIRERSRDYIWNPTTIVCSNLLHCHIWTGFLIDTCEKSTIEIDKKEKIQDIIFTRKNSHDRKHISY